MTKKAKTESDALENEMLMANTVLAR